MERYKKNVIEFFEETLASKPNKVAVVDGDRKLTFAALAEFGQKLACLINKSGAGIRKPIGVFLPKSIESVEADFACVYSGNAYMNMDVKWPVARLNNIFERVKPALVITDSKRAKVIADVWPVEKTILIDGDVPGVSADDLAVIAACREEVIDFDPFCIINTSGSTGTPKGVVLNHRSFIDYVLWAIDATKLREDEVLGSIAPIVFDHSSYEFCLMLMYGCTLVFTPESYAMFPVKLLQLLVEKKVTYIFWVPTLMVNIANMDLLSKVQLPDLRMVWFAGEVFPTKQFNYWRKSLPQATFVNLYGPTEITVDCTYYIVNRELRDDEPVPIGFPCRNTDILILNAENKLVGKNEDGELCVRGSSLSMGYYNNPEKTAAVFVQNPLNDSYPEKIYRTGDIVFINDYGEIVYKGRNDTLVKHLGKRIELGEIEHVVVNTLAVVKYGAAVYDHNKKEIVFFYESDVEIPVSELRKKIGTALPNYMIPTRYIQMTEMPRGGTGKIDRAGLNRMING